MKIRLSFKRMFLAPGKTFAVPTVSGARVRVVDGLVWATTSSSPDDVWLGAGEEYTVPSPGLTVIESIGHSTVELVPPAATGTRGLSRLSRPRPTRRASRLGRRTSASRASLQPHTGGAPGAILEPQLSRLACRRRR